MHINNKYVRKGTVNPRQMFTQEDVSDKVKEIINSVPFFINEIQNTITIKVCPEIAIGMHCSIPYDCPFLDLCLEFIPEHSAFTLYRIFQEKCFNLVSQGLQTIEDLPVNFRFTAAQLIRKQVLDSGKPHIDVKHFNPS